MKIKFFNLAKRLADKSDHHSHRLGAVLVQGNKIVSVGWNQMKTSPHSNHPFKSSHAEFNALAGVKPVDLKGAEIYVYREKKDGTLGNARPCKFCMQLLKGFSLKRIHYSNDNGNYFSEIL